MIYLPCRRHSICHQKTSEFQVVWRSIITFFATLVILVQRWKIIFVVLILIIDRSNIAHIVWDLLIFLKASFAFWR